MSDEKKPLPIEIKLFGAALTLVGIMFGVLYNNAVKDISELKERVRQLELNERDRVTSEGFFRHDLNELNRAKDNTQIRVGKLEEKLEEADK